MNDSLIEQLQLQIARDIRRAKSYLAHGSATDARRHATRAQSLLTVLAHARLVRVVTQLPAASLP
ncbi:MAG: hypothetical protein HZC55_04245 [Verrucomicrobia bacterium]|nr:hypothetical protein [Verrucomicrobiota bacterium]